MKPEHFIREQGLDKAREVVEGAPGFPVFGYCTLTGNYIFKRSYATAYYHNETNSWSEDYAIELILLEDLKRLVESVDRVNAFGGLKDAKAVVKMGKHYKNLKAHISNYESIYGGGDE
ncbi:hypothetical protein [Acinetobacter baumannii]|uniref:hypothetical protein n=1 Tax=Acinetobacter baumannii TaxID=470 RepID=UPI0028910505|nr:hypothetical protein [Acinetobacter baumannii]HDX6058155.1 hypothetical protein [Acinetobacter baumannii]